MSPSSRKAPAKPAAKAAGPGRPKDLGKRTAILEAAKTLFIEQGYTGVCMDSIAALANVSKLTVYSHFGDKEALFLQAVQSKCIEMLPDELFVADARGPLREQLLGIGRAFFDMITSDAAVSIQRVMMSPETDQRLRELFWQAGPQRTCDAVAEFLRGRAARGELDIDDAKVAAQQLLTLVKGELHAHMMCGMPLSPVEYDAQAHVTDSVDFFLRAYAPKEPRPR
ncbi:MAG: Biofilm operon icaADBC HTH-type negative transcriptional regulator IcaR [Stenotrophomonas maltophilia]|uniref:Biofilm operon icaADBC HTH-type negative transcriptional regulator IcaR n=1 Tax=Stenotrophomonas maltophilia TaxID=40324 RepID=A0A7V8FFU0_STEMA|nr:MAG: Biofilm operon icaADBC HTH-type negative transcriptional regulator IcaR [Stenotrophomonas maltophilia]